MIASIEAHMQELWLTKKGIDGKKYLVTQKS
jgi:hypothetical protein